MQRLRSVALLFACRHHSAFHVGLFFLTTNAVVTGETHPEQRHNQYFCARQIGGFKNLFSKSVQQSKGTSFVIPVDLEKTVLRGCETLSRDDVNGRQIYDSTVGLGEIVMVNPRLKS